MPSPFKARPFFTVIALLAMASAPSAEEAAKPPGEILVLLHPGASPAPLLRPPAASANTASPANAASNTANGWQTAPDDLPTVGKPAARTFKRFPAIEHQLKCPCGLLRAPGESVDALLAHTRSLPGVDLAAPNHIRTRQDIQIPEDARVPDAWHLKNNGRDIDFFAAWALSRPEPLPTVIAILDTGVDYRHQDLIDNMWTNPDEIPNNNRDDDGNGIIDDVFGFDAAGDFGFPADGDPMDGGVAIAHGTHVAALAGATLGNDLGANGACPSARIMALKGSPNGGGFPVSAILSAIDYAIAQRNRGVPVYVINASLGGPEFNSVERSAYVAALNAGIVITAAAGNESVDNETTPTYPANYDVPNILSVGATTRTDAKAGLSNFSTTLVDIAAPGEAVFSARPTHIDSIATAGANGDARIGIGMVYSGMTAASGITGNLIDCGIGRPEEFPAAVRGNLALIERGTLFFSDKVANATAAGAIGAIIYNNEEGGFSGTLQTPSGMNIPAIGIPQTDGETLRETLNQPATLVNTFTEDTAYETLSGTSMSAPLVAGAIALAAAHYPDETPQQLIARVLDAADVLPGLESTIAGGRRLNLRRILDTDEDTLPDWWELEHAGDLTTLQNPVLDPDNDGLTTALEWLAVTNPLDAASRFRVAATPDTIVWSSAPGRRFTVEATSDLQRAFAPVATDILATSPQNRYGIGTIPNGGFFRVRIQ